MPLAAPEIQLFLEKLNEAYGYDFRQYAEGSLSRRLLQWLQASPFGSLAEAQAHLLVDPGLLAGLIQGITISVTEMFRDPSFFQTLRTQVLPQFRTWPFIKVWLAGCATGEEAYSMAILLQEAGLAGRFRIYATDIDPRVVARAREGVLPLKSMQLATRNYQNSGGTASFADYYSAGGNRVLLKPSLRDSILFASHNLVTDAAFGEMNLVLCRNVLIYFQAPLRDRALELFNGCLPRGGFLGLGLKETLAGTSLAQGYQELAPHQRIYRKF